MSRTAYRWATTRLAQCKRHIEDTLQNDLNLISQDEAHEAVRMCQDACCAYLEDTTAAVRPKLWPGV